MKKFIALIALAFSTPVFAQAVATLPTAPSPPTIITTSPNATEANSVATTNKVYIDQAGDNATISITQDGTGSRTLAYGSYWDFANGAAPTLTTTANAEIGRAHV